ncbi:hypothetical protein IWQ62_000286 [Dispira parvispora]|uniref:SHSP domain-containing protein n=1 Tax=Dispira parvispora TaxID=1520584 RepID=A0A9W8AV44_9FUNG|nr:hypothetical protein IWQ62_000286 [Dispira parvispora]
MPMHYSAFSPRNPLQQPNAQSFNFDHFIQHGIPQRFETWAFPRSQETPLGPTTDHGHQHLEVLRRQDDADGYAVHILIPHVVPASLRVTALLGGLTLRGHTADKKETTSSGLVRGHHNEFSKTFSVPAYIDTSRAEAYTENGIVTIRAPRRSTAPRFTP